MSEQAPEAPRGRPEGPPPGKKENVLTRKIGPLPTWVWVVMVAAVILLYFVWKGRSSSGQQGQGQQGQGGFGSFLQPFVILGGGNRPPHTKHHHKRGDHDDEDDEDKKKAKDHDRKRKARSPSGAGPETDVMIGVDRRHKRGEPVPGELVGFKTAEQGQTPSLMDVANHYNTDPDAIVLEATGRGSPSSTAWKRYVARHDWASPLPNATDLSILAHPQA